MCGALPASLLRPACLSSQTFRPRRYLRSRTAILPRAPYASRGRSRAAERSIDGVELEFHAGRVVAAAARTGAELLRRLLETDDGAARLGEVSWVPKPTALARTGRCFRHPLLDENAFSHIALGDAYPFTVRDGATRSARSLTAAGANRSLIHVDLPLDVTEIVMSAGPGAAFDHRIP